MALILVIDDEPAIRQMVRRSLERDGHTILEAPNGREGIALARAQHLDLIITDIVMPEMEGIETILVLRGQFPVIPIIAMSGGGGTRGMMFYLDAAAKLGANATLAKPFRPAQLAELVKKLLAARTGNS